MIEYPLEISGYDDGNIPIVTDADGYRIVCRLVGSKADAWHEIAADSVSGGDGLRPRCDDHANCIRRDRRVVAQKLKNVPHGLARCEWVYCGGDYEGKPHGEYGGSVERILRQLSVDQFDRLVAESKNDRL